MLWQTSDRLKSGVDKARVLQKSRRTHAEKLAFGYGMRGGQAESGKWKNHEEGQLKTANKCKQ